MISDRPNRLSYEESCQVLQDFGYLDEGEIPTMPSGRPGISSSDGLRFYKSWVGVGRPEGLAPLNPADSVDVPDHALANLTLPRTFIGRSEISFISFRNTDLSESTLCWNDFIEVDFTDADLSGSDLRSSIFRQVGFLRTNLRNADLRRSTFEACDFTDAEMVGAKLTHEQGNQMELSERQRREIDWQDEDGEEPSGG